ncbi:MAG: helix-turn-helix transcriptional regulator [Rhodospirillales bacterium]|nr:helix-turn-helix transcriptional regulator [Rhodospirillales bacterium]
MARPPRSNLARRGPVNRFGPWTWEGSFFDRGELPPAVASILDKEGPQHGYELMKILNERSGGLYNPSAGTIYPLLQQLEDQELVSSKTEDDGKRVFELTKAGHLYISDNAQRIKNIWERSRQDEWTGWNPFLDPDAMEIMRPAFRLMRIAVRTAVASSDPNAADDIRLILREAGERIDAMNE